MTPFEIFLIAVTILYVGIGVLLSKGAARKQSTRRNYEPVVSVIVPARNEEENIGNCLQSLRRVDYPSRKLQIIVVDDHSEDKTASVVREYCTSEENVTLLTLSDDEQCGSGKISALAYGYECAEGEIVFQTDADCEVSEGWIKDLLTVFGDDVGIVGGMTLPRPSPEKKTCFIDVQTLDLMYLLGVGAGANSLGIPLSCFGNNLAIRKKAYDAIGGYESIPFTFTEDFAIFQAITRGGWNTGFALTEFSLVYSRPPRAFRDFINQRLRWAVGGIKLAGKGVVLLVTAFVFHLAIPVAVILGSSSIVVAFSATAAAVTDLMLLIILAKRVGKTSVLWSFPLFEVYFFLNTSVFGLVVPFAKKLKWKGRKWETSDTSSE